MKPQHTPGDDPRLLINILGKTMKPNQLGPPCRKCDGQGYYCVELPLQGGPPDNRRKCEICGGDGYERIKKNPLPGNPKIMTSLERDQACEMLRMIFGEHIRHADSHTDPVRGMIEDMLQKIAARK